MSRELQSTLDASAIKWPALTNHIPWMAHVIQLALGAFMSSLDVKGRTTSWEAHERDQQFGMNESMDIGKSQGFRKESNAAINKVSAMKPGVANIIEKLHISWYFECPGIDNNIAENACGIDYADTWSSEWVHWLSESQCSHPGTTGYGCEDTFELNTGVGWARLPITGIGSRVAPWSTIHCLPSTLHISRWMDHCEICHGSIEAISILDPVNVE